MDIDGAANGLAALGHPTRLKILRKLLAAEVDGLSAGTLSSLLGISPALLSSHLRILDHADLISRDKEGRNVVCRARRTQVAKVLQFLATLSNS